MIRIDLDPGIDGKISRIGKAMNKAIVFTLTDSAKFANEALLAELKGKIDRPAPFTLNRSGYGVTIARFDQASPFSESFVKPAQAAYEQFIMGMSSVRGLGMAGASNRNVFVPGQRPGAVVAGSYSAKPRLSQFGGVPNSYSKSLYGLTAKPAGGWGAGGVFWATRNGKTGFWARPKRTKAVAGASLSSAQKRTGNSFELRQRGPDGRFIQTGRADFRKATARRGADARVKSLGVPVLLLERRSETKHHEIVAYAAAMQRGHDRSIAEFQSRFARILGSAR